MSDILPVKQIETVTQIIQRNIIQIQQGSAIAIEHLKIVQEMEISNDDDREVAINTLAKCRSVFVKVQNLRKEATGPLDEIKSWLMTFEKTIDDEGKENEYALAKKVVADYDQGKLDAKKKAELDAELARKVAVYKSELKAGVARQLTDMIAGEKKTIISQMARWEAQITLETFEASENKIKSTNQVSLKIEKYDACFNTNFKPSYLLNSELTKEFIESLKSEFPYDTFNKDYQAIATEIINDYRAKMPSIKSKLEEIKDNAEKALERQKDLESEALKQVQQVDKQSEEAIKSIENTKDMETVEADFVRQGTLSGVEAGPSKNKASFENDTMWLVPFQQVIGHVATTGVSIRKKNGEYIDAVQFWLTKFEVLEREVNGIQMTAVAKTIVRGK